MEDTRSKRKYFDFVVCSRNAVAMHEVDDAVDVGTFLAEKNDESIATNADDKCARNSKTTKTTVFNQSEDSKFLRIEGRVT